MREDKPVFLNRISTKLAMVGFSFTLPIATMLSLMIAAKQKDLNLSTQARGYGWRFLAFHSRQHRAKLA
ncbi:MAG TPA: hypothetical protein VE954_19575 [Oligoflexus sp.]|uniref:hypothetical protein n=1 Tax=Oligoflexus sp. TaxID=1971216 RepID=UPI002D3F8DCB|nr:hypothetical protein [Oligoflexus sp.]HYX35302.1 hypothetical protein [Oligoflexus sp.]